MWQTEKDRERDIQERQTDRERDIQRASVSHRFDSCTEASEGDNDINPSRNRETLNPNPEVIPYIRNSDKSNKRKMLLFMHLAASQ